MSYFLLFTSAFLAATLLPFYSEAVLATLLTSEHSVFLLWAVATAGNTLGAAFNWWLGKSMMHYKDRRWFPFKPEKLAGAQRWFTKYGKWSLLFSWLPIGGDALTFIAGIMRIHLLTLLLLAGIGKGLRYAFVIYLFFALPL